MKMVVLESSPHHRLLSKSVQADDSKQEAQPKPKDAQQPNGERVKKIQKRAYLPLVGDAGEVEAVYREDDVR
jgi:hypothetical protein